MPNVEPTIQSQTQSRASHRTPPLQKRPVQQSGSPAHRSTGDQKPSKTKKVKKKEGYWDKLDRSDIRRIKTYVYTIEIIIVVVLILGAMYESIVIDPFYFPIGYLLFFILFLIFLLSVEGLWFKFVMIKTARSYKKRTTYIKEYQQTAQQALVVSIVILILILSISFLPIISDAMKTEDTFEFTHIESEKSTSFEDQDTLGLTHTNNIYFDSNNTVELKLHIREITKDFEESNIKEKDLGNKTEWDYQLDSPNYKLGYSTNKEYHFFIVNGGNNNVSGKYVIEREVSRPFVFNIMLFMLFFIITSVIWLAYLSVIKKKYKKLHEEMVSEVTKRYAVKQYTIEDVFLIYINGTLISHQTRRLKPMDNDILSGMLTAIKDFIRDVFKGDTKGELNELSFGKLKILIEHGEFAFLAVVVSGKPPKDLRTRLKRTITEINQNFYPQLKNYRGDPKTMASAKTIIENQLLSPEAADREMDLDSDAAWNNKGVISTKLGKYNEALDCFDRALKLNSHVSNIWLNRGIALVKMNEFEEAMDCFDRALQLDPHNDSAKRRRNKCWYKWKLMEGREDMMMGSKRKVTRARPSTSASTSASSSPRPRTADYARESDYDYDYDRQHPRHEFIGGPVSTSTSSAATTGRSTDYYSEPYPYDDGMAEEPPPRCPRCKRPLEFIDEYDSWYCGPCDSYPFDD